MDNYKIEPLYRRNNSTAHGGEKNVRDYTPLYKFLLSKVGQQWERIYSQAINRLDKGDPIFHLVAIDEEDKQGYVRCGESSYYSGLFVDNNGVLQKVDPSIDVNSLSPSCKCCTHTFNGKPFTKKKIGDFLATNSSAKPLEVN